MPKRPRSLLSLAVLTAILSCSCFALTPQDDAADQQQLTDRERALLVHYKGDTVLPVDLLKAYAAFVADTKTATAEKLKRHCLPHSVQITSAVRPPERRWLGRDMNIPFLRSEDFYPQLASAREEGDDCYQLRTGSSGLYFVQTRAGEWRIYSYFDKAIQ